MLRTSGRGCHAVWACLLTPLLISLWLGMVDLCLVWRKLFSVSFGVFRVPLGFLLEKGIPCSGWACESMLSMMPGKGSSTACWGGQGSQDSKVTEARDDGPCWRYVHPQCSQHHLRGTPGNKPVCGASSLTLPSCSSCGCRLTGTLFPDTSTAGLPCLWMLQQYLIKSGSFSRNLQKKTQTNLSLFLWLISVLLNCLEFYCQQAAEPPYPSGMSLHFSCQVFSEL